MVTLTDAYTVDTTADFSDAGTYVLRLTADDGEATASDEVTIVVYGAGTVVTEVRVAATSDDAEEGSLGGVSLSSGCLELVSAGGEDETVGIRFRDLAIPRGATMVDAYVQFQVDETSWVTTSLTIEGEDIDDAPTFISSNGNISSRGRTEAAVSWSPMWWWTVGEAGPDQRTPDMASVIQEIVNRPGWSSGNSLLIIITGSGKRTAEAYDGIAAAAPLLHVGYLARLSNDPPVAEDDAYSTHEDTPLSVAISGVLGNETGAEGDALSSALVSDVSDGNLYHHIWDESLSALQESGIRIWLARYLEGDRHFTKSTQS